MKHSVLSILLIYCGFVSVQAQSVAINTDGSAPDASAILDVKSMTKGLLIPRMETDERIVITNPATGLIVYDTDSNSFWCYGGGSWIEILQGYVTLLKDADADTKIQVEESTDEDIIHFDLAGTQRWVMTGTRLEPRNSGQSVFIGEGAGANDDLSTNHNVFVGYRAGNANTTGFYNTAAGFEALFNNTTGHSNTAEGRSALYSNTTADGNTANGNFALSHNKGNYNTAIGNAAFDNVTEYDNSIAVGHNAQPGASNTIRLGNSGNSSIGGYANWSNVSDGRFKVDVKENVAGLEFIKKLRPVTYHLDMDALAAFHNTPDSLRLPESEKLKKAELQVGFIAQEVETAAKEVNFNFHGVDVPKNETSHYGLRYAEFVVPLVKAVQEQQEIIEMHKAAIDMQLVRLKKQELENANMRSELEIIKTALLSVGIVNK